LVASIELRSRTEYKINMNSKAMSEQILPVRRYYFFTKFLKKNQIENIPDGQHPIKCVSKKKNEF
jgi:ASC-1-like (ASCH) protein